MRQETQRDALYFYMQRLGDVPLLQHYEEVELAQSIEAGRDAWHLANAEARPLDPDEHNLFLDGLAARDHFISANLRLVFSISKTYSFYHHYESHKFLDVIQAGGLGLEHAVEKFEWRKGFKFSTYASNWVRQQIRKEIRRDRVIGLPDTTEDDLKLLRLCESFIEDETELLREIHWKKSKLDNVRAAATLYDELVESLDKPDFFDEHDGYNRASNNAFDQTSEHVDTMSIVRDVFLVARAALNPSELEAYALICGLSGEELSRDQIKKRTGLSESQQHGVIKRMRAILSHPTTGIKAARDESLAWQFSADCRDIDFSIFFPKRGGSTTAAKLICSNCAQIDKCKGVGAEESNGIWAGQSERARKKTRGSLRLVVSTQEEVA